jgi:Fur family ferric uptake transcriptional regulator
VEGKDLRKAGLKVTLPRLKILEILEHSTTRHMSAEEIYKKLLDSSEDIGLATVYRVLTQFEGCRAREPTPFRRRHGGIRDQPRHAP